MDNTVRKASFNFGRINRSESTSEAVKKSSYVIPLSLHRRLKKLAVDKGMTMSQLILEAFNRILADEGES